MSEQQVLDRRSRLRGCLYGGAIGDAFGAPLEFLPLDRIRAEHGEDGLTDLLGHPPRITDDTQMTVWTADGLIRARLHKLSEPEKERPTLHWVYDAYLRWLCTQKQDPPEAVDRERLQRGWLMDHPKLQGVRGPGMTCLSSLIAPNGPNRTDRPANRSKGCGTVMRVAPVAALALSPGHAFEYGAMTGALTHGHPTGWLASATLGHLLYNLFAGEDLIDATLAARDRVSQEMDANEVIAALDTTLDLAARGQEPTARTVTKLGLGWVAEEALAIGLFCALATQDASQALTLAVNHSGDSDSTGSICGHILGAWKGAGALPGDWVVRVDLEDLLLPLVDDCLLVTEPDFDPDHEDWDRMLERYPID